MELLAPAGNMESLKAAVINGADAVYMGGGKYNARAFAQNFDNLRSAADYAHSHGVKVYFTLNTLVRDREINDWLEFACDAANAGVDAFIVQDLGGAMLLRKHFPTVPLHASTQMTAHNTDTVLALQKLGFSRIILARELREGEIRKIKRTTDAELEVFVHGALCCGYSGQCFMSSILSGRSANRGQCAQTCRHYYHLPQRKGYLLSTKDLCLVQYIKELRNAGISTLKIEGRMKGAEYVGAVTAVYRKVLDGHPLSKADIQTLHMVFNRGGFTSGMFGGDKERIFDKQPGNRGLYLGKITNVSHNACVVKTNVQIAVGDMVAPDMPDAGKAKVQSVRPAGKGALELQVPLSLETGTGLCLLSRANIEKPGSRDVFKRAAIVKNTPAYPCPRVQLGKQKHRPHPVLAAQVQTRAQANAVLQYVSALYIPAGTRWPDVRQAAQAGNVKVIDAYPAITKDGDLETLNKECFSDDALLVGSLIQTSAREKVADYSFNVMNSQTLAVLQDLGFKRATLSPELNLRQMEDLYVPPGMQTEIIVYGYMPLMITEHCPVRCDDTKNCSVIARRIFLKDKKGGQFPMLHMGADCRVCILNAVPLYMADKLPKAADVLRMFFSVETPAECQDVASQYGNALAGKKVDAKKANFTRGHFTRGV